jgi:PAS domain S-box-containing protein
LSDERKDLAEKIRWLLLLRVVILSFFLGATALFHFFAKVGDLGYLFSLSIPLIIAYAISIGSAAILPRLQHLHSMAYVQVGFDVLLITGIIWITGDVASPFSVLYNLAVMNGAILLFYRGAFVAAICSSLFYTALLFWSQDSNPNHGIQFSWTSLMPIVLSHGSFFVIAGLSGFLANKLSETERLLQAKQIDYRELDAFKDALLQGIGSGVAITDQEGRINYFNPHAQILTSLDEETVRGKRLYQIFPGLSYDFQRNRSVGSVITDEMPYFTPQGEQKQIRVTLAPLSNSEEKLIGFVSIFDDITKQKQIVLSVRLYYELLRGSEIWFAV